MPLLLQLNGDLPQRFPHHERRLYVFGCGAKRCQRREGTVKAVRAARIWGDQKVSNHVNDHYATDPAKGETRSGSVKNSEGSVALGDSIFGANALPSVSGGAHNPFATRGSDTSSRGPANPFSTPSQVANRFSGSSPMALSEPAPPKPPTTTKDLDLPTTFAQKVRLSSPSELSTTTTTTPEHEAWPDSLPSPYPTSHLDAAYEILDPPSSSQSSSKASKTSLVTASAVAIGGEPDDGKDGVEMNIDRIFQKFADRVAQNPEQVLRYEFDGQPILCRRDDVVGRMFSYGGIASVAHVSTASITGRSVGADASIGGNRMPRCGHCGSGRVFEFQLMPHAITELEEEEKGLEGMEWGTVIIGVCGADCADDPEGEEGKVSWREEWVGVQWEEEVKRR